MVAHFRLRTYERFMKKFAIFINLEEKAECYEEVANHSQLIYTLIQNNNFMGFHTIMTH